MFDVYLSSDVIFRAWIRCNLTLSPISLGWLRRNQKEQHNYFVSFSFLGSRREEKTASTAANNKHDKDLIELIEFETA